MRLWIPIDFLREPHLKSTRAISQNLSAVLSKVFRLFSTGNPRTPLSARDCFSVWHRTTGSCTLQASGPLTANADGSVNGPVQQSQKPFPILLQSALYRKII